MSGDALLGAVPTSKHNDRSVVRSMPQSLGSHHAPHPRRTAPLGGRTGRADQLLTVRISNQMRAWFNGPRRMGNGPGQRGLGLGDGWSDGDVEAEGPELAEVGADLAVAVGFAFVPVGSEVGEPGRKSRLAWPTPARPSKSPLKPTPIRSPSSPESPSPRPARLAVISGGTKPPVMTEAGSHGAR